MSARDHHRQQRALHGAQRGAVDPFHHEMSYAHNWPSRLYFYGDRPSVTGGATPVASERRIFPKIPTEVRERFQRHGVRYVRNYGSDLDLPWQEVFQTGDRAVVEAYCEQSGTAFEWTGNDSLRTVSRRQALAEHPRTGETVWFRHALYRAKTCRTCCELGVLCSGR
nr:TauD/TfdA family dioxygenase [Salinispora arenicola]